MDTQQRRSWKILLIGDHCIDIYHYGVCERLSPEAPVPILKETNTETKMGMSSNVRMNLKAFGLSVHHEHNKHIIQKHRLIDSRFNHHLLRYDVGEGHVLPEFDISRLDKIKKLDAVVISDYDKGFLRYRTISQLCEKYKDIPIFADTKKQKLGCFSNCVIKINEKEFKSIKAMPDNCEFVVTLGPKGALYNHEVYHTEQTEVFDVCGAGDVFLSGLVYGFLNTKDMKSAILTANKCASFSVSKMGTYVMTQEDLKNIGVLS